jgi:hypothetical protein
VTDECGDGTVGGPVEMLSKIRLGTVVIGKSVAHGSWLSASETKASFSGQLTGGSIIIISFLWTQHTCKQAGAARVFGLQAVEVTAAVGTPTRTAALVGNIAGTGGFSDVGKLRVTIFV